MLYYVCCGLFVADCGCLLFVVCCRLLFRVVLSLFVVGDLSLVIDRCLMSAVRCVSLSFVVVCCLFVVVVCS